MPPHSPLSPIWGASELQDMPETPAPQRARVTNLNKQVDRLVKEKHSLQRKAASDNSSMQETIYKQKAQLDSTEKALKDAQNALRSAERELERCKQEGDGMREELNMFAVLHQQKALLALAEEQMRVVELQQEIVKAEQARVMRDHKIFLFQIREAELVAEVEEKDDQIEDLEEALKMAKSDLKRQSATSAQSSAGLTSAHEEKVALQAKVEQLQASLKMWKDKEREARVEVEAMLKDEKSSSGATDKEKKDLQKELRAARADIQRKDDKVSDLQDELESLRELGKEREKHLKAKLRAAMEERGRNGSAEEKDEEEEITARPAQAKAGPSKTKAKVASPVKAKMTKSKKPAESDDNQEDRVPPKKAKKPTSPIKKTKSSTKAAAPSEAESDSGSDVPVRPKAVKSTKQPLAESSESNKVNSKASVGTKDKGEKRKSPEVEEPTATKKSKEKAASKQVAEEDAGASKEGAAAAAAGEGEKKKKRKFGLKAAPAFQWDPIEGSGTGVIPSTLSPMKIGGTGVLGIKRAGMASAPSNRMLSKFM